MGKLIKTAHALDMGHYGYMSYKCSECHENLENEDVKCCPKCGIVFTEKEFKSEDYPFGGSDY